MVQSVNAHHTVAHLQDFANLLELEIVFHIPELHEQDVTHFAGFKVRCH